MQSEKPELPKPIKEPLIIAEDIELARDSITFAGALGLLLMVICI